MLKGRDGDKVELRCPECGALVEATAQQAESGRVKCPRGHVFPVVSMLAELGEGDESKRHG